MHHFIFPSQDTYITNQPGLDSKNFGIDEILRIGTVNTQTKTLSPTKNFYYTDAIFNQQQVQYFTGTFIGSVSGTSYMVGNISGSGLLFASSYFSGSVDGVDVIVSGSVGNFPSGSSVIGYVSGSSYTTYTIDLFDGVLSGSTGCLSGTGSGFDAQNIQNWQTGETIVVNRTLLQFDLSVISASIVNNEITSPAFSLILKVCNEYELPINYTIFALPISQSWNMGNGYLSDNGSDSGASWNYLDNNYGNLWYDSASVPALSPRPPIDFINDPTLAATSFLYGGSTFYTSSIAFQHFNFQSSDINMDITPIVMNWLNGSIPNNGLILISSDELEATGSGFVLTFFSQNTNTIYSPYLDIKWSDVAANGFITGSFFSSSVTYATASSGISASITSGSMLNGGGGVSGSFSASAFINIAPNYITASGQIFNSSVSTDPFLHDMWYNQQKMATISNICKNKEYWYYRNNASLIESNIALNYWENYENWGYDTIGWGNIGGTYWNPDTETWSSGGNFKWTSPCFTNSGTAPAHGNYPVMQFSGSFTGSFNGSASYTNGTLSGSLGYTFTPGYFSGSVDNTVIEVSNFQITGSTINGIVSGSLVSTTTIGNYNGILLGTGIYLYGTGSGTYLDSTFNQFSGFVNGNGLSGNISGDPVFGIVQGLMTISQSLIYAPCGNSFSASYVTASFLNGPFSGDIFTAYYLDYKFENALLTGSWSINALLGENVNVVLPSSIYPYTYAYVYGPYFYGNAIGLYQISSSTSASFNGQFIDGNIIGTYLNAQLTGSVNTASYYYTSSVNISSSFLNPLNIEHPFTVILQNVLPEYKLGDIAKINVFGRKKFPLKTFERATQQVQYIVPEYLPTSSYYALKDDITGEIVVNFDQYTAIGCEYPNGNYFVLDTTSLPLERYYRVLIRVENSDSIYTVDTGKTFKIIR